MGPEALPLPHWVRWEGGLASEVGSIAVCCIDRYPGGLKEHLAKDVHKKDQCNVSACTNTFGPINLQIPPRPQVLRKAVNGMLPKNNQRKKRMRRLYLFPDEVRVSSSTGSHTAKDIYFRSVVLCYMNSDSVH